MPAAHTVVAPPLISPSPGTLGEGWGEGLFAVRSSALTLTLSRRSGRGNRKVNTFRAAMLLQLTTTPAYPTAFDGSSGTRPANVS